MNIGIKRFVHTHLISNVRSSILKRGLLTHQNNGGNKYVNNSSVPWFLFQGVQSVIKVMDISGVPKIKDSPLRSTITDPVILPNGDISIPFNVTICNFELPTLNKHELIDPVENMIEKKAHKEIRIRRRKMKKHKWKKLQKKMKFVFAKVKKKRRLRKENIFKEELKEILASGESYNPELILNNKIEILNTEKPINRVRGIFCPKWVVDEHLEKEKKKKILDERVAACLKKM